ncbi:MAG: tetratricopeptide repeat protein [Phycisphaerae bacterium]
MTQTGRHSAACPAIELLDAYASGDQSVANADFVAHLQSCSDCATRLDDARANNALLVPIRRAVAGRDASGGSSAVGLGIDRSDATAPLPTIPGYEIGRKIGEGGMGVVFEGRQINPPRPVALKLVRHTRLFDEHAVRLFQREARALARLVHPSIAAIYDAGSIAGGQHYFAMELVQGASLLEFAKRRNLKLAERLALFARVASAIHYAHQRGVIHRDIKPSNILVSDEATERRSDEGSGGGRPPADLSVAPSLGRSVAIPKVLDFGLARVSDIDDSGYSQYLSETGRIAGTPAYMSPEQTRGKPDEIDVRSDVYSLGVILYQLLTNELPYPITSAAPLHETVRAICETPPKRPSAWNTALRGDLDVILLKALAKEPAQRYSSAAALGEDVERFLANQPIVARPPSTAYQIRKLVERHKIGSILAGAAMLALVGFGVTMNWLYQRADEQRARAELAEHAAQESATKAQEEKELADEQRIRAEEAEHEAQDEAERARKESLTASRVKDLLLQVFELADPMENRGESITAKQLLDDGVERAVRELESEPDVQIQLLSAMSGAIAGLGSYGRAVEIAEQAVKLAEDRFGQEAREVIPALERLASVQSTNGQFAVAAATTERMIALQTAHGASAWDVAMAQANLGEAYRRLSKPRDAAKCFDLALPAFRERRDQEPVKLAEVLNNHALLLRLVGKYQEAEVEAREAIALICSTPHKGGMKHAVMANTLMLCLKQMGRLSEAEEMARENVAIRTTLLGAEHPMTTTAMNNLASLLTDQDRNAEAEPLFREVVRIRRAKLPPEHPDVATAMDNLASALIRLGGLDEAGELLRESLAHRMRNLGENHEKTGNTIAHYARYLEASGDQDGALAQYERMHCTLVAMDKQSTVACAINHNSIAVIHDARRSFDAAEAHFREALAILRRVAPTHPSAARTTYNLGVMYLSKETPDQAEPLLREAIELALTATPPSPVNASMARSALGSCLTMLDRVEEAEPLLLAGYREILEAGGEWTTLQELARERIRRYYLKVGQPERAAEIFEQHEGATAMKGE